jgi:uncharacterized repeat protein (TIGR01451 family)
VEEEGVKWKKGSMAFPTGLRESSGLLIEKMVPVEVLAGQAFQYQYRVINLTDYPIHMVTLTDRVTPNFSPSDADPKPADMKDNIATWQIGSMAGKETKIIKIKGMVKDEGSMTTCGWATYSPILCEDIKIVKANIQLTKNAPADTLICEPIPMKLTVKNNGTSSLTSIKVTDNLPDGLTSGGQTVLSFDAGTLTPGQSKDFTFNAMASKPGRYVNNAKTTSAQGVTADASSTTSVHQPVLTIACKAPEKNFMNRPFTVCYTVMNKGDAPDNTTVEVAIPAGVTFSSATAGGHVAGNRVVWDFGSLGANVSKDACATFVSAKPGNVAFNGTTKGTCAKPVSTDCETLVIGQSGILLEKSDDPDPIEVGATTTYTVRVTNQGTADDNNVGVSVVFPAEITPITADGGTIDGQAVKYPVIPRLAPKDAVTHKIVAKGVKVGDAHVKFNLTSDALSSPISAEESTHVY